MNLKETLSQAIQKVVANLISEPVSFQLEAPVLEVHGDYATNVSLVLAKRLQKNSFELAQEISSRLQAQKSFADIVERTDVIQPGFINFWIKKDLLLKILQERAYLVIPQTLAKKRMMVEYAHPNTHKEMHIGHMRTLITGEAVSRLLEANGAQVFRANYQGDIGPHIAKALYGIQKIMEEESLSLEEVEKWDNKRKTHFLGQGYVRGIQDYESHQQQIDKINAALYEHDAKVWDLYQRTRKWNLDYYDEFYKRFYTKFDRLFFESEMAECGKQIVLDNLGKVFEKDQGAIIFRGEKYGLHTRVFITQKGLPLYEAKDICNAYKQYEAFPFDLNIHVVANEQAGYFQVVFKALELLDPQKFKGSLYHLSMGMVNLVGRKMSSRTGEILLVDDLIDQVKERISQMVEQGRIKAENKDELAEMVAIGAVKYSVLRVATVQNVAFDIAKSVSLEGNSGPYLQYTYARTQSVLAKSEVRSTKDEVLQTAEARTLNSKLLTLNFELVPEELSLLRFFTKFPDILAEIAKTQSPHTLCEYLYTLAQKYNLFYQKHNILKSERKDLRLAITKATSDILVKGLDLLGIKAPEKM